MGSWICLEKFKEGLEKKIKIANILLVILIVAFFANIFIIFINDEFYDVINKWGIDGLVAVFAGTSAGFSLKYSKFVNSESELKKEFLKQTDERLVMIRSKSSTWAFNFMIFSTIFFAYIINNQDKTLSYILFGISVMGLIVEKIIREVLLKKY
jgi:hypothetical protein